MASFEQLVFEIIARDKNASASFDRVRRSIDNTSGSLDKNTQSLNKNQQAQKSFLGATIGVGTAFGAMLSPISAATSGVGAFAALAVPSIHAISTAISNPGGLQANLGLLDAQQRKAGQSILNLQQRYDGLAKAMEPQVFQVFNTGLRLADSLLGPVAQLAQQAAGGIEDLFAGFTTQSGIQQFISFLAKEAAPALTLLGQDVTALSHAVFALLESFGGIGLAELKLFTVALTGLANGIAYVAQHTGPLLGVALAIGGIALALQKLALLQGALKLTGLAAITEQLAGFTAATTGATLAEKGLLATTTILEAITPWGWAIAGIAALGGLIYATRNYQTGTEDLIATMAKQDKANGLNVEGYQRLTAALQQTSIATLEQHGAVVTSEKDMAGFRTAQNQLTAAQITAQQKVTNLQATFAELGSQYGLNQQQVKTLIIQSHSLNDVLAANGKITPVVAEKIRAWAQQEQSATGITNSTAIAIKTLTDDMNKNITAVLTLQGDDLAWQSAMQGAKKQLDSNSAGLKGNSADAIANKQAVLQATQAAVAFATEQLKTKGNLGAASNQIEAQIRFLRGLHDQSGFTKTEIQALVDVLRQIKSEQARIKVSGTGSYSITQAGPIRGPNQNAAAGWLVSGGTAGRDSVPIMAMPGELVVPTRMVQSGAVDHLRGSIPGFAGGGIVGSYSDGVPGLTGFIGRENKATIKAIENATAAAVFATLRAGSRGGSFGAGVARWRPDVLTVLGMLGLPYADAPTVLSQLQTESGGNPYAINLTDINAQNGDPSRGLMQTIMSTFLAYAGPFRGRSIYDPMANIYAGVNYAIHRYGNPGWLSVLGHGHGYDQGGWLPTGPSIAINNTGRPEQVIPPGRGRAPGGDIHVHIHAMPLATKADIGRAVISAVREAEKTGGTAWRTRGRG
ncbi:MAG TPA: transglycosylase SLT domain-containing protein [Streptosporangiaceae bacterium]